MTVTLESIAKHGIDHTLTTEEIVCLLATQEELERLRRLDEALRGITDSPLGRPWHVLAMIVEETGYKQWTEVMKRVADALEE